jgi:hypothetical protein
VDHEFTVGLQHGELSHCLVVHEYNNGRPNAQEANIIRIFGQIVKILVR